MKTPAVIAGAIAVTLMALPVDASSSQTLTTRRGKIYHDVQILKVEPDGLTFRHQQGAAKVPFTELEPHVRQRFDKEVKAAEVSARQQEQQRRIAQARRQQREAEARVREAARQHAARRPDWAQDTRPTGVTLQGAGVGWSAISAGSRGRRWRGGHIDQWRRPFRVLYAPSFYDFRSPVYGARPQLSVPFCPAPSPPGGFYLRR